MARNVDDSGNGQANHNPLHIDAGSGGGQIDLPSSAFISDANILRDGQDLVLRLPDGPEVVVDNYFLSDPAPLLVSPQGAALTHDLVESFVKPIDGVQYAQQGTIDDSTPVGMIKETSGDATVTHVNGIVEKAAIGTAIYQDDIIKTEGNGAVNVTFVDDTTFAVSGNARLAIDDYVFDPTTQTGESNFSIMQGVFVFTSGLIGREDPDDVRIDTPVGSIGIRGTTIMGDINPTGESRITIVEGAIVVSNQTGEQTLSQEYETVSLTGMTSEITQLGQLSPEQIGEIYTVMRTVSAQLFSQIDENIKADDTQNIPQDGQSTEPTQDAAPQTDQPTETTAPSESDDSSATQTDQSTDTLAGEPLLLDQSSGFDTAAQIDSTATLDTTQQSTSTSTSLFTDVFSGGDTTVSLTSPPPVYTTDTKTLTTTTQTTLAPPAGTTTAPPPYDILVNSVISGAGFISGSAGTNYHQGASVLSLGDYNHNGVMDFAFTSSMSLFLHNPLNIVDLSTAYSITPSNNYEASYLGDINGDGFGDVIFGTPGQNGSDGMATIIDLNNPTTNYHQILGNTATASELGHSVSGIGDFNGDGYNDMLIGAPALGGGSSYSYVVYGKSSFYTAGPNLAALGTTPTDPDGFLLNAGISTYLGESLTGLQDFNGDGYADFATSKPGAGAVNIIYGTGGSTLTVSTITGITNSNNEIPIFSVGDMNGGGKSDLGIYQGGTDTLHILYGENALAASQTIGNIAGQLSITSSAGTIINGGSAGDFNGDGFDDIAVASRNGSIVDVYVIYGHPGFSGTIDLATLDPKGNFHARIDLAGSQFDYANPTTDPFFMSLSTMGDRNNDGFDDLMIGLPNIDLDGTGTHSDDGGIVVIDGRSDINGAALNIIQADGAGNATATASGQTLFGGNGADFLSNGSAVNTDTRYLGGAGNDHLQVFGASAAELNGGTGVDKVEFMSSGMINLSAMGENLSGIERIQLSGATTTLKLGIDDIFRLLQDSETRSLTIDGNPSSQLIIEDNTGANPTTENLTYIGFTYGGDTNGGTAGGYNVYNFGGYSVLISDAITAVQVA